MIRGRGVTSLRCQILADVSASDKDSAHDKKDDSKDGQSDENGHVCRTVVDT